MIGMSQIRKRLIYGILIGAGIGIFGIGITLIWALGVVKSYKNGTNKEYLAKHTTEVVMLNRDVIQGETITDSMLTTARIHKKAAPTDQAGYSAVGKIAKYNIPANIPLVNSMFGEKIISTDERIQEVTGINLPSDLVTGDYMDVKLKMASGLEYVVLPQIKVEDIRGTTVFLHLDEENLYYLNSAIVDTYLSGGASVLYGVRYVDPTTQIKIDDSAIDMAKLKLSKTIEQDVANGTVSLTLPSTSTNEAEETNETSDVSPYTDTNTDTETTSQEYINFSDNLADLLLKYAIEYRYYIESYGKVERTYQPSSIIMNYMKTNKYIADEAKKKLDADARRQIEARVQEFESTSGDKYQSAISGLTNQISAQQSVRNSALNAQ